MSYSAYEFVSEKIKITREGPSATVTIFAPWSEAIDFGLTAVGGYRTIFGSLSYFTPLAFERDGLFLWCNDCDIEGMKPDDSGDWTVAKITLVFGVLDQPEDNQEGQDPTQVADYTYQLQAEELLLPKEGLHVDSIGGEPPDDEMPNPILVVPKATLTAAYPFKPRQDAANWKDFVGKVNSGTWKGHTAETVMFVGPRTKRTRTSDGKDAWEYELVFEVRYNGWNKIYDPGSASWKDLHPAQYETADFDDLLSAL